MCTFCKIIAREIPASILYETDEVLAFSDLHPAAPVHALVIPKKHVSSLDDAQPADAALLGQLLLAAKHVAHLGHVGTSGYRTVINNGEHAGQSVSHLHVHVLGGRALAWPPG